GATHNVLTLRSMTRAVLKRGRRHKNACVPAAISYARCRCAIWVQDSLHGRWMRQSLDMSNWEDASKKVREWETGVKPAEEMSVKDAIQKFLDDAQARYLSDASIGKLRFVLEKQLVAFCERKGISTMRQITFSDVIEFRKSWADNPLSASKKFERLKSCWRSCEKARRCENGTEVLKERQDERHPTM